MTPVTFTTSTLGVGPDEVPDARAAGPARIRATAVTAPARTRRGRTAWRQDGTARFYGRATGRRPCRGPAAAPRRRPVGRVRSVDWEGVLGARVLFVSGKGGTGKSTVAAALATAAAATGRRTILVEVEGRYELGRTRRPDGDVEYDLVVVDAPPTGQIVPFLGAPDAFAELIRMGRMRRHASTVATFLHRHARVVLVALPEEMAVRETLEALPAVTRTGVTPAAIVANRCSPPAFPVGVARAARRLTAAGLAERVAREGIDLPDGLADALIEDAHDADARHRSERSLVRELAAEAPLLELPDVPAGSSRRRVRALAGAISGAGPAPATPGGRARGA